MKNGKLPFHDDYASDKTDPLHVNHADFDYEALEQALNEAAEVEPDKVAVLLRKLFEFATADLRLPNRKAEKIVGRRFIALAWVLDPRLFEGSPSATALAKQLGLKRKEDLLVITGQASRTFGITNRGQGHAWNRGTKAPSKPQDEPETYDPASDHITHPACIITKPDKEQSK